MVNLTNDGWYGDTTGPYQHFAIVRVRAIEEGLPLIRVANTGISGVIDPLGRITSRLGLEKQGYIDSDLATPLIPTLFEKEGEIPVWIVFVFITSTVIISHRPKSGFIKNP
jgi:apolipoprotein N-acyltransferase